MSPNRRTKNLLPLVVLACTAILSFLALIQPWSLRQDSLPLQVGDVAPQDLQAPRDFSYISTVLTDQARDTAERTVAPVYGELDLAIGRQQADRLGSLLEQINEIRETNSSTLQQKLIDLAALNESTFTTASANLVFTLPPDRWDLVSSEALFLLGRAMSNPIRTEDLDAVRQGLPAALGYTLTEPESNLVVELVAPLVAANSFYSPELTEAARQVARDQVEPITQTYLQGQTIVYRGQLITEVNFEALSRGGLVRPESPLLEYSGAAVVVTINAMLVALYFFRRKVTLADDLRGMILLAGLFLLFLLAARIVNPNRTLMPYLFPVPAFALIVSVFFGMERGMVFGLVMSVLASYGMPDPYGLMPYYILTSLCGVLALGEARRVMQFFYAVIAISGSGAAIILAYRLVFTTTDWIGIATLLGATVLYAIVSSALVLPLQFLLAPFLGATTPMQLLEISRPDSPLLSYFLQRAPGTYQHSLQVANLAERAAERIHADALLTRVGALFHDIGKAANPLFFIENQSQKQVDSHEDLPPEESAATIIRHIRDGLELARKYRLPRRLEDFIAEHHGTLLTRYQHNRALQANGGDGSQVDEENFRYPGPPPHSKETALLMFADGVEARARAERPKNDEELRAIVRSVIESRQREGQLAFTPLTQRDLTEIIESFTDTLKSTFHPRLEYPQDQPAAQQISTRRREKTK